MSQPNKPTDSELAHWMRDTFKQTVEDAEHDPEAGEDSYIGTMIPAGEPTLISDAGADGFAFRQDGVEYTAKVTARRLDGSPTDPPCLVRSVSWSDTYIG